MKTVAVTGSSGFIGKYLLNALNNSNYEVIELDFEQGYNLLLKKDIKRVPKFDIIVHLAAKSFVPQSFKTPRDYYYQNFILTLNVLEMARRNASKVIFLSSYLYGTPEYLPMNEHHPLKPHNPYAQSKLLCEILCEGYNRDFHFPIIIFRPFNIYGHGQHSSFLIPSIINQLSGKKIILKDPRPKRDFIYVTDVCRAIIKAIEYQATNFEIFNLGYGQSYSVEELIQLVVALSNSSPEIIFTNEYRQGEVLDTIADISKIGTILNWQPNINLKQGLSQTINK